MSTDHTHDCGPLALKSNLVLGPLPDYIRDELPDDLAAQRVEAWAAGLVAAERERWAPLVAELLDTELGELASAGSHAPVEDVLGRLKDVLGPNARANLTDTAR